MHSERGRPPRRRRFTPLRPIYVAKVADFEELTPSPEPASPAALDRLLDVTVSLTAELGRATLAVGEVLKLGVGSVVRLDRNVSEPVDLFVQGVRLAARSSLWILLRGSH